MMGVDRAHCMLYGRDQNAALNAQTKASRNGTEARTAARRMGHTPRTPERGEMTLPSVSYTMLSGGTVRVDQNNLSVNCTHRRNGSDSTAGH